MNKINTFIFVLNDIDSEQYDELLHDFQRTELKYKPLGYIERTAMILLEPIFMPNNNYCNIYINTLNKIMNKWKDYDPYLDEGGI